MARYRYRALNATGQEVQGQLEADDRPAALRRIDAMGLLPIEASAIGGQSMAAASGPQRRLFDFRRRLSQRELTAITRELARLVGARVPVARALAIMQQVHSEPQVNAVLGRILETVRGGRALADALRDEGAPFDRMYVSMVHAGEQGGALPDVLGRLADYLERAQDLRATIQSALIYPAILLGVAILSLVLLLTFVVPQFEALFQGEGVALPYATQVVIGATDALTRYWWAILLGFAAMLLLIRWLVAAPPIRAALDRRLLDLPVMGRLTRTVEAARLTRLLGTLIRNGVPLMAGLGIARDTVINQALVARLESVRERLKRGEGFAGPLGDAGVLPPLAVQMVRVGEETGALDQMLLDVADLFDEEARTTIKRLLTLLEPVLILLMGGLVGGIIMSILVAVMELNTLAL